jgi:acetyltransferase
VGTQDAEFAILVSDVYQGSGLGTELLRRLLDIGRQEGVKRIFGSILNDNVNMLRVTERLGFKLEGLPKDGVMRVGIEL